MPGTGTADASDLWRTVGADTINHPNLDSIVFGTTNYFTVKHGFDCLSGKQGRYAGSALLGNGEDLLAFCWLIAGLWLRKDLDRLLSVLPCRLLHIRFDSFKVSIAAEGRLTWQCIVKSDVNS